MGHGLEVTTGNGQGQADDEGLSGPVGGPATAETGASSAAAEIAVLRARHVDIEARLAELGRHPSMTPAEQLECARLKKEKLAGKDRLAALTSGRAAATMGRLR